MKYKFAVVALMATALAATPLAPANARGWDHYHGGHGGGGLAFGVVAGVAAVTGAAIALATAPFNAIAEASAPPPPAPVYYAAPAPAYYAPVPQQQVVVYGAPRAYYGYPAYYGYGR
jgi:hypothetical protein